MPIPPRARAVRRLPRCFALALALGALAAGACGKKAGESAAPKKGEKKGPPSVVASSPKAGDAEVDPALAELSITFDQEMGTGASLSANEGLGQLAPDAKSRWEGKRTLLFPLKLEPGKFYRIALNAGEHTGFRSAAGVAARPTDIWFCTKGASDEVKSRLVAPKIVKMAPANGATDADAAATELRIEFDKPMGKGTSFSGGGETYPETPDGQNPKWSEDRRTCIVPVKLRPGQEYKMSLNAPPYASFRSEWGVPLAPAEYAFRTAK